MTTKETPAPGGNRGTGYCDAATYRNNTGRILATHFCVCRPGVPCIFCLAWNRLIRRIESRRKSWMVAL